MNRMYQVYVRFTGDKKYNQADKVLVAPNSKAAITLFLKHFKMKEGKDVNLKVKQIRSK